MGLERDTMEKKKRGLKKGAHKSTKIGLAIRVDKAEELLSQGLRNQAVIDLLKQEYNVQHRTAQNYIYKALKQWEIDSQTDDAIEIRNARRMQMRTELENLYEISRREKDIRNCYNILDRLCKLDNLYAPDQVEVTVNQGVMVIPGTAATEAQWIETTKKKLED